MPNKRLHTSSLEKVHRNMYRHVVVILCHMHVYSGMGTRCTVYASTKDQSNGTLRINIQGQNLRAKDQPYGPMGTQCMYKRTIL